MNLDKRTREKLYKAEGKPISIDWPLDAPEPHGGRRYAVHSEEDGSKLFSIRLERSKRVGEVTRATVRLDNDPVRIMPGLPGIRTEAGDYEDEPERVDERFEELLAQEALQKTTLLSAEQRQRERANRAESKAGRGKLAQEYALRERKRLEAA